jgi:cytoskeletal protein CcmA (bactofilin family)
MLPGWGLGTVSTGPECMKLKDDAAIKISESVISTIISEDTVIEGNLISSNSVRLGGCVRGDITAKGLVIVGKGAEVRGNITAENILVAGRVDGNLNSVNKTNIESTGEVYGDIATRRLLVDEESVFFGKCSMMLEEGEHEGSVKGKKTGNKKALGTGKEVQEEEPSVSNDEISFIDVDELRGTGGKKQKGGRRRKQK